MAMDLVTLLAHRERIPLRFRELQDEVFEASRIDVADMDEVAVEIHAPVQVCREVRRSS
jgi:hypothetical protein